MNRRAEAFDRLLELGTQARSALERGARHLGDDWQLGQQWMVAQAGQVVQVAERAFDKHA